MSDYYLQRAAYHLSLPAPLARSHRKDPAGALADLLELAQSDDIRALRSIDLRLELTDDELEVLRRGDVAELYRRGVHPNTVRNFAGNFGIDYLQRYREAGIAS